MKGWVVAVAFLLAPGLAAAEEGLFVVQDGVVRQLAQGFATDVALRDGRMVASTAVGVLVGDEADQSAVLHGGTALLTRIEADREGQLWVGVLGRGLARIVEPGVVRWDPADQEDPTYSDKLLDLRLLDGSVLVTNQS